MMDREAAYYIVKNAADEILYTSETPSVMSGGQYQERVAVQPQTVPVLSNGIPGEKQIESNAAAASRGMATYQDRFRLTVDKAVISADDTDAAQVTVHSSLSVGSIDIDVNGTIVAVSMSGGVGYLPPITSNVAEWIIIQPADKTTFMAAGQGFLRIEAIT